MQLRANFIDTDTLSASYRDKAIDIEKKRLLITNFHTTEQERDFKEPANCNGFGRIRHFSLCSNPAWPKNPLPIEPASRALGISNSETVRAQVFQNAVCNWRCWYCYVPFDLLSANPRYSTWMSPAELIDLYLNEPARPQIIDLSGGQPDLIPEWIPWMMQELQKRGLDNETYLWSDDNLSTDYFWRYLTAEQTRIVKEYKNYGKVCCFKGFDNESFSFNTKTDPSLFDRQFSLMKRNLALGIDIYGYVTLTSPNSHSIADSIHEFVERLVQLSPYLPLRIIPLAIREFTPVIPRLDELSHKAMGNQRLAIKAWQGELKKIYTTQELSLPITDIKLESTIA